MTFALPFFRLRISFSIATAAVAQQSQHDSAFRRQRNRWPAVTLGADDPDLLRHRYLLGLNL